MEQEKCKLPVTFTCPYCGHKNIKKVEGSYFSQSEIVYCDCEDGGCDRQLVITFRAYVDVKTRALVDEMEESKCQQL